MSENVKNPVVNAAADTPQAVPPTPEQVVEQLRALMASIQDVPSLTEREREIVRKSARIPDPEIQASINVVGAWTRSRRPSAGPLKSAANWWRPQTAGMRLRMNWPVH